MCGAVHDSTWDNAGSKAPLLSIYRRPRTPITFSVTSVTASTIASIAASTISSVLATLLSGRGGHLLSLTRPLPNSSAPGGPWTPYLLSGNKRYVTCRGVSPVESISKSDSGIQGIALNPRIVPLIRKGGGRKQYARGAQLVQLVYYWIAKRVAHSGQRLRRVCRA
jgi:hypothetical protein